jgi:hypothetical protein
MVHCKKYLDSSDLKIIIVNANGKIYAVKITLTGRIINMDPAIIAKQMIDFQKTMFDNTFNAMVMVQEQTERMTTTLLDQAAWMPSEGRNAISGWVNAFKKGREDFKKGVDENFKRVEDFFITFDKEKKAKK